MKTPSPVTIPVNTMKPPFVSSTPSPLTTMKHAIPALLDIDAMAPLEFHFPAEEPWWDEYDFDNDTSDYFSSDSLSIYSNESEFELCEDLNLSFPSKFYHICDTAPSHPEATTAIPTEEVCRRSPREDDEEKEEKNVLIGNLLSTISKIAPKFVYNRRKNSMKRKKKRQKRKRRLAENIDPELRSLWNNSVGDLFAHSAASVKAPSSSLPTINMNNINRTMLRRLPEVVDVPVLSCSEKPEFYTKTVGNAVTRTTSIPFTEFDRPGGNCFGKQPAILTDLGPVPPPTDAQFGYVYVDGGWKVKAESPSCSRPRGPPRRRM